MTNLDLLREKLENLKTVRTKLKEALDAETRVPELWEKMQPAYEDLSRLVVGPDRRLSAEDFGRLVSEISEQKEIDAIRKRRDQVRAELQHERVTIQPLLDSFRNPKTAAAFDAIDNLPDAFGLLECERFIALLEALFQSSTRRASGQQKRHEIDHYKGTIRILIIKLRAEGLSHKDTCSRLDASSFSLPANTSWKHYGSWAKAFKHEPLKVGPWLSRQK